MAKVSTHHFDEDRAFVNGMEAGVLMIKQIFEMTVNQRINKFGMSDVASIIDTFDFAQIKNLLEARRGT